MTGYITPCACGAKDVRHPDVIGDPEDDNVAICKRPECFTAAKKLLLDHRISVVPIPMILTCPSCNARHIDTGKFATKPHHTHACQSCGTCWRPAVIPTVGVRFLPGFKDNEDSSSLFVRI